MCRSISRVLASYSACLKDGETAGQGGEYLHPSAGEAEVGGVRGQPGLYTETLSQRGWGRAPGAQD